MVSTTHLAPVPRPGLGSAIAAHFIRQVRADGVYPVLYAAGVIISYLMPAIIGMFWGAPLISRELEGGTYRLAWSQSVTRSRWLAVKLGLLGLAAMAVAGLFSLVITWWASPLDQAAGLGSPILTNRMTPTPPWRSARPRPTGFRSRRAADHRAAAIPGGWVVSTTGHRYAAPPQVLRTCYNGPTSTDLDAGLRLGVRLAARPAVSHLPARQPLLAAPGQQDGDRPRPGPRPVRALLLGSAVASPEREAS